MMHLCYYSSSGNRSQLKYHIGIKRGAHTLVLHVCIWYQRITLVPIVLQFLSESMTCKYQISPLFPTII